MRKRHVTLCAAARMSRTLNLVARFMRMQASDRMVLLAQYYQIDADDVTLEMGGRKSIPIGLALPDMDSLLTNPLQHMDPIAPAWRTANSPEWRALQVALAAAPRVSSTSKWIGHFAHSGIANSIRRWPRIDRV
jgi:hypothetical protein